ncbi:MetQ/NlpA family ABC transporter substrate-binding protein [Bacillus sp. SB49]|uniref:MetQ/NlpA family ABC transporter substrate-binding protein n=1 Tax=Bacillaceae TaxID=186817 RepID=UPI0002A51BCF|nr:MULTISPECIES: MetQ/NlpA family ABC transporter substrate-binding protein [Bacillaceae]ELK45157.1 methionine ABC transporter extracellular binding protein [Halobacillus sp. BAB-2008]QHT48377.1 MetQ/NlpA family ABC transporter substrate-binding protein [Bacillus sp. SB49]
MKKWGFILSFIAIISFVLAGCSSEGDAASGEKTKVKVGLNGSGVPIWEKVQEKAEKENIDIELVEFADYVRPNMALADGDIDLNAFQTVSYFDSFIEEHDLDLKPIGTTIIAPMGVYSEKYKDVKDIPDGSSIAVPKEATNMGRALLLLEQAGLIGLPEDFDGNGSLDIIEDNPKNLKFEPIVAAQTPRVLPDVAASVINNGVAVEAGFVPVEDAVYIEDETAQPYINIIAARADEADKEVYQKIVELYQEEDVADHIKKTYNDSLIPTFVPLEDIGW